MPLTLTFYIKSDISNHFLIHFLYCTNCVSHHCNAKGLKDIKCSPACMFDFLHLVLHREYARLIWNENIWSYYAHSQYSLTSHCLHYLDCIYSALRSLVSVSSVPTTLVLPPSMTFALCWKFFGPSSHYLFTKPFSL